MKKFICIILLSIPVLTYSQKTDTTGQSTALTKLVYANRSFNKGDTVVNLNSLNYGVTKIQVGDKTKAYITENGLKLDDSKGIVTLENADLLKSDVSFDIKTFSGDNEWYENSIRIKVKDNDIRLVNVSTDKIEMATGFRKEGKIYVVVAVSMILFFTIIGYLIYLERKTKKMEKQLKEKN